MLASYALIVRRSAAVTAATAAVMVAVSAAVAGGKGVQLQLAAPGQSGRGHDRHRYLSPSR